ncbi:MAG TPA: carboxypeptidase-like regulatory domain-containing protein [Polyangiales bacterium]
MTNPDPARFTTASGTGICQVCHTTTRYYNAGQPPAAHHAGEVCTSCHNEQSGLGFALGSTAGTISGTVTDSKIPPAPLAGVVVKVEGLSNPQGLVVTSTTAADGSFTLADVPSGPVFLSAAAPNASYLDTETTQALLPGGAITGISLVLSSRPSDSASYVGLSACTACHAQAASDHQTSAHYRSLTRIVRDSSDKAVAGAFARVLNKTLTTPRVVMIPLAGTVTIAANS